MTLFTELAKARQRGELADPVEPVEREYLQGQLTFDELLDNCDEQGDEL